MTKTLTGCGLTVELDTAQVFPHDPGRGTPAMVSVRGREATYWCALNEGEVEDVRLTAAQVRWLERNEDAIVRFLGL